MSNIFELDIAEIWIKGSLEKDRLEELHIPKEPVIKIYPNGFKEFYCPNCNEEFYNKKHICFCGQLIKWNNEYPWY